MAQDTFTFGCLWHAVLLHEAMPGFINKHNMGQGVIADRNTVLFIISVQNVGQ
jgi:hypothetical protein